MRASRLLSLLLLLQTHGRLTAAQLAQRLEVSVRTVYRAQLHRDDATIRLSPYGRQRLREIASDVVAGAAERNAGPPDAAGWVTTVVPIESLTHAHGDLLRLGAEVEVLAPAELRAMLAATAAGLAALYPPRAAEPPR